MTKKKILHNGCSDFSSHWMLAQWQKNFDVEKIQPSINYNIHDCIVWVEYLDKTNWHIPWAEQGFKIIVYNNWDTYEDEYSNVKNNCLFLYPRHYPWMHENLMYNYLGYRNQILPSEPDKFFLLLMNLKRDWREQLFYAVKPYLADSLYSYASKNIRIPGDQPVDKLNWQRYFNPTWYASTCFSVVSETLVEEKLYVSEKSFKPLAFRHPFVIYGTTGNLKYLHSLGFETFNHVFDESYDNMINPHTKLAAIKEILKTLYAEHITGYKLFSDKLSQEKIQHNFNKFYDASIVENIWQTEMITPILNFING
jgi:hypothetical protein